MAGGRAWRYLNKARSIVLSAKYTWYIATVSDAFFPNKAATTALYRDKGKLGLRYADAAKLPLVSTPDSEGEPGDTVDWYQAVEQEVEYLEEKPQPYTRRRISDTGEYLCFNGYSSQASLQNGWTIPETFPVAYRGINYYGSEYAMDARVKARWMYLVSAYTYYARQNYLELGVAPVVSARPTRIEAFTVPILTVRTTSTGYYINDTFTPRPAAPATPPGYTSAVPIIGIRSGKLHPECNELSVLLDCLVVFDKPGDGRPKRYEVHHLIDLVFTISRDEELGDPTAGYHIATLLSVTEYPGEMLYLRTHTTYTVEEDAVKQTHVTPFWWGDFLTYSGPNAIERVSGVVEHIDAGGDVTQLVGVVQSRYSSLHTIGPGPSPESYTINEPEPAPDTTVTFTFWDTEPVWPDEYAMAGEGMLYKEEALYRGGELVYTFYGPKFTAVKGVVGVLRYKGSLHSQVTCVGSGYKLGYSYDDSPESPTYGARRWVTLREASGAPSGDTFFDYTEEYLYVDITIGTDYRPDPEHHGVGFYPSEETHPEAYSQYMAWLQGVIDGNSGGGYVEGTVNSAKDFQTALFLEDAEGNRTLLNYAGMVQYFSGSQGASLHIKHYLEAKIGLGPVKPTSVDSYMVVPNPSITETSEETGVSLTYSRNYEFLNYISEVCTHEDDGYGFSHQVTAGHELSLHTMEIEGVEVTLNEVVYRPTARRVLVDNGQVRVLTLNRQQHNVLEGSPHLYRAVRLTTENIPSVNIYAGITAGNLLERRIDYSQLVFENAVEALQNASLYYGNNSTAFKTELGGGYTLISSFSYENLPAAGDNPYVGRHSSFLWILNPENEITVNMTELLTESGLSPIIQALGPQQSDQAWAGVCTGYAVTKK
jgi:hypothetical protein